MSPTVSQQPGQLCLAPFEPGHAAKIAQWVETAEELRWVAPSSHTPLTAAIVVAWKKPEGEAFILTRNGDTQPIGYGELNPMRNEPDHLWIGHIIVRPDQRGYGAGETLVRTLVKCAFERRFASRVSLIVFPDNTAAVRCYSRVGFRIVSEEYHRFGGVGPRHRLLRLQINPLDVKPGPRCEAVGV